MTKANTKRDVIEVYIEDAELGLSCQVGTIYRNLYQSAGPISFEYADEWAKQLPFALDPRLPINAGEQFPVHPNSSFGIFLDSAPDRWGRVLMERREAAYAKKEGRRQSILYEMDFLLGVNDETRQGALRFKRKNGQYLDNSNLPTPSVTQLAQLEHICQRIESESVENLPEYEKWLSQLVAPGSSLGGARPKANFREVDQSLWIAKFPAQNDRYDVGGWEYLTHMMAKDVGIWVPDSRCAKFASRYHTFCVRRFDRKGGSRRMYASAMTLLEKKDGEEASYLDIAEFIINHGASGHIGSDLEQLYRRVIFNIFIRNTDDHLRNHGFVRAADGWRLSDAFDMNPNTAKETHALNLDEKDPTSDLTLALETASYYRIDNHTAESIMVEMAGTLTGWQKKAKSLGLPEIDILRMQSIIQVE
ncbi:type II toxin-antitoxin system HipA family toxin [Chitinimonas sp. PSY-7]|uniref:HipA domain-containing protein n=1 Tax=Chitinimonas sp. PSY-7 TaxID=3459088 RepID=UPI0040402FE3